MIYLIGTVTSHTSGHGESYPSVEVDTESGYFRNKAEAEEMAIRRHKYVIEVKPGGMLPAFAPFMPRLDR